MLLPISYFLTFSSLAHHFAESVPVTSCLPPRSSFSFRLCPRTSSSGSPGTLSFSFSFLSFLSSYVKKISDIFVMTLASVCPYIVPIILRRPSKSTVNIDEFKRKTLKYKVKADGSTPSPPLLLVVAYHSLLPHLHHRFLFCSFSDTEDFEPYANRMVGVVHLYAAYLILPTTQNQEQGSSSRINQRLFFPIFFFVYEEKWIITQDGLGRRGLGLLVY